MSERRIFTICLIEEGERITALAEYTGDHSAVYELGLELLSDLVSLESSGEGVTVGPLLRGGLIN